MAKATAQEKEFICLECGSKRCRDELHVSVTYSGENPWAYVAARDVCFDCGIEQPRALARRWNHDTVEAAKATWLEKFKNVKQ